MTLMYLSARISKHLSVLRDSSKKKNFFADNQIIPPACCYDARQAGAKGNKYIVHGPRYIWRSFNFIMGLYYVFLRDVF